MPQKPRTPSGPNALQSVAAIVIGKTAVFCLNGDQKTKSQLEAESVKKMQSWGFDATEGRHVIPPSDSYSSDELAIFLRGAGFRSITEITYDVAVASENAREGVSYQPHWISQPGETHYPHYSTTRMGLDDALRTMFENLTSKPRRD